MTAEALLEATRTCAKESKVAASQETCHIVVCNALGVGHYQPVAAVVKLLINTSTPLNISFFAVVRKSEAAKCVSVDQYSNISYRKFVLDGEDVHPITMQAMISRRDTLLRELSDFVKMNCDTNGWAAPSFIIHDTFALFARDWSIINNVACAIFNPSNCFFWVIMETESLFQGAAEGKDSMSIYPGVPEVRAQLIQRMLVTERQAPEDEQEPVFKMYPHMEDLYGHACAVIGNDVLALYPWAIQQHLLSHDSATKGRAMSGFSSRDSCPYKYFCVGPLCLTDNCPDVNEDLGKINGEISLKYWLDQKEEKSVIFVALGTLYKMEREVIQALFESLKHCPFSFVWSYRELHSPPAITPSMLASLPLEKGVVLPWVHQKYLLMHPALRLFISHCGWNSTLENMCYGGLPMMCLPLGSDQLVNTIMLCDVLQCGRLGMIQNENWDSTTKEDQLKYIFPERALDFSRLIRETADLHYNELLLKAKEVQVEVLKAGSHRGSMVSNVEAFVKHISGLTPSARQVDDEYEQQRSRMLLMTT